MDSRQVLELVDRGWSVMPISRKKIPLVPWRRLQSHRAGRRRVREWWSRFGNPDAGVITGLVSGIVVVDCDTPTALEYCRELGYGETFAVRTGRGFHLYFEAPDELVRNSVGRIAPGVDVRGEGGYVVAPGSRHASGAVYEVVSDTPLAACPAWVYE